MIIIQERVSNDQYKDKQIFLSKLDDKKVTFTHAYKLFWNVDRHISAV